MPPASAPTASAAAHVSKQNKKKEDGKMARKRPAEKVPDDFSSVDEEMDEVPASAAPAATPSIAVTDLDALFDRLAARQSSELSNELVKFDKAINDRITNMEGLNASHFQTMTNGFNKHFTGLTDRLAAHEEATKAQFVSFQNQISAIQVSSSAAPSFADVAAAAASQARPSSSSLPSRPATTGPAEECLVFIRGFPVTQPGIVLREYSTEALDLLPPSEAKAVRVRVSPADTQFSLVFPLPSLASAFVEEYRSRKMVYRDDNGVETPLTCRTGKPIALRRRGGLIRPMYTLLEEILSRSPRFTTSSISQSSKVKLGVMTTDFFALQGKTLTPLFALTFQDHGDHMTISALNLPTEGCPLAIADIEALRLTAIPA
jgi:hypothetical protein